MAAGSLPGAGSGFCDWGKDSWSCSARRTINTSSIGHGHCRCRGIPKFKNRRIADSRSGSGSLQCLAAPPTAFLRSFCFSLFFLLHTRVWELSTQDASLMPRTIKCACVALNLIVSFSFNPSISPVYMRKSNQKFLFRRQSMSHGQHALPSEDTHNHNSLSISTRLRHRD